MIRGVHKREVDRTRKQAIVRRVSTFLEQSPASRPRGESAKAAVAARAKSSQPCGTKSELKTFPAAEIPQKETKVRPLLLVAIE